MANMRLYKAIAPILILLCVVISFFLTGHFTSIGKYGVLEWREVEDGVFLSVYDTDFPIHYVESFRWPWEPEILYNYTLGLEEGIYTFPAGSYILDGTLRIWDKSSPIEETLNILKIAHERLKYIEYE